MPRTPSYTLKRYLLCNIRCRVRLASEYYEYFFASLCYLSITILFITYLFVFSHIYGNVLVVDGVIQCTEHDQVFYDETLAHLPLSCHLDPKKVYYKFYLTENEVSANYR